MLSEKGPRWPLPPVLDSQFPDLQLLHGEIDRRVVAIRHEQPAWPCAKGCGGCCQRLAEIPRLTQAEWQCLQAGLEQLPAATLAAMTARLAALKTQVQGPYTCPLLDADAGACLVYPYRPVACRTYGYYVARDAGCYCGQIQAQVAAGALDQVIWGNHEAVDQRLAALGESRSLSQWWDGAPSP